ncbi:MAG: 2-amino-4-hydroxy-6-hydroxymethyldihydropteridine diphosphokinase [Oligoflexales bacterium]
MSTPPQKAQTAKALIAFGSNLGNRLNTIRDAIDLIKQDCGHVIALSKIYETAPIGNAKEPFLNGALICETTLSPAQMMENLLVIEQILGRTRDVRWGDRTIDLDIILWKNPNNESIELHSDIVELPHPRAAERSFVIVPCCDIAGDWPMTKEGRTIRDLFEQQPKKTRDLPVHGIPL